LHRIAKHAVWPAAVLLLGAACIPKYEEPEIRLEAVRLGALGIRGGTVWAHLVVTNPNRFPLQARSMSYELHLVDPATAGDGWLELANGVLDHEVHIAPNDSAVVELPVDFTYDGVGTAMRAILRTGVVDYRLSGDLQLREPIQRRVPFRRSGRVDLVRSP
jgi:LEA14-like dessication related protein